MMAPELHASCSAAARAREGGAWARWRAPADQAACKVRLCRTVAAALGFIVIAAGLEVDGSSQVYHTTNTAIIRGE
jgi:hypothetical protein